MLWQMYKQGHFTVSPCGGAVDKNGEVAFRFSPEVLRTSWQFAERHARLVKGMAKNGESTCMESTLRNIDVSIASLPNRMAKTPIRDLPPTTSTYMPFLELAHRQPQPSTSRTLACRTLEEKGF
jgi:hypothetical protein